jgi:hypothetical protein
MKQADEALLRSAGTMKSSGNYLFNLDSGIRRSAGFFGRRDIVTMRRTECYRMNNAGKQDERQHAREQCAGLS